MVPNGLEVVFLEQRDRLVRFLRARGAGDSAEDLVQDLWVAVSTRMDGPIANPVAYLHRAADRLMIDRHRSRRQSGHRELAWERGRHDDEVLMPTPEREVAARQMADQVSTVLSLIGERKAAIFRRVRVDGVAQRAVAAEFGVSLSTVESDLREATRALSVLKEQMR